MSLFRLRQQEARSRSLKLSLAFYLSIPISASIYYFLFSKIFGIYVDESPKLALFASGALVFITFLNFWGKYFEFKNQDAIALARKLGAFNLQPEKKIKHKTLKNIVEELSLAAKIKEPPVYLLFDSSINAFVLAGKNNTAVIIVTTGALTLLNRDELSALIAHEIAHIRAEDVYNNGQLQAILHGFFVMKTWGENRAGVISPGQERVISLSLVHTNEGEVKPLGRLLGLIGFIFYYYGRFVQAKYSRSCETRADLDAIELTGNRLALIRTLKKALALQRIAIYPHKFSQEWQHLLFNSDWKRFFSTHPPLEERIRNYGGYVIESEIEALAQTLKQEMNKSFNSERPLKLP